MALMKVVGNLRDSMKSKITLNGTATKDEAVPYDPESNEFPTFLPTNSSLTAKYLTKELWEKLKDRETRTGKWTLARAVNTGVVNQDSVTGCNAGDADSYDEFAEFFDKVIEDRHGFKPDQKHVTDLDSTKVENNLPEDADKYIQTSRIRVVRNLAGYPLNPSAPKEDRLQVEDIMEKVFNSLNEDVDMDLAGTYYSLETITEAQRKQLTADDLLFNPDNRFQAASGYHNHWPAGRGVFHNKAKTLVVWVNQGDHLKIISTEKGADIAAVFERLTSAIRAIEEGIRKVTGRNNIFQRTEHLGHISCCPTNLGTGLRGGVHVSLPKLFKTYKPEEIDATVKEYDCEVHGKIAKTADVSNFKRLGQTEVELVQTIVDTVARLIAKEKELVAASSPFAIASSLFQRVKAGAISAKDGVAEKLSGAGSGVSEKLSSAKAGVSGKLSGAGAGVSAKLAGAKSGLGSMFDSVKSRFSKNDATATNGGVEHVVPTNDIESTNEIAPLSQPTADAEPKV